MIMSYITIFRGGTHSIISVSFNWEEGNFPSQFSLLLTGSSSDRFFGLPRRLVSCLLRDIWEDGCFILLPARQYGVLPSFLYLSIAMTGKQQKKNLD